MTETERLRNIIRLLNSREPDPPLFPKKIWSTDVDEAIRDMMTKDTVKAGVFLWNDDIERAHKLAQEIHNPDGSYWHAILHRRDRDFSNSKYWYDRTGDHPVLRLMKTSFENWDPHKFVDDCAEADRTGDEEKIKLLEKIQAEEIRNLMDYVLEGVL